MQASGGQVRCAVEHRLAIIHPGTHPPSVFPGVGARYSEIKYHDQIISLEQKIRALQEAVNNADVTTQARCTPRAQYHATAAALG